MKYLDKPFLSKFVSNQYTNYPSKGKKLTRKSNILDLINKILCLRKEAARSITSQGVIPTHGFQSQINLKQNMNAKSSKKQSLSPYKSPICKAHSVCFPAGTWCSLVSKNQNWRQRQLLAESDHPGPQLFKH